VHTVLVVDDHAGFRVYARLFLTESGFRVVGEAADGASAITETIRLQPDLLLLDVQLPDIDGFEVARRLRERGVGATIVLISTRDASDYGDRIASSDVRGFVAKSQLTRAAVEALLR
jgi:DNA-binding NarL/FixJ family response regulator